MQEHKKDVKTKQVKTPASRRKDAAKNTQNPEWLKQLLTERGKGLDKALAHQALPGNEPPRSLNHAVMHELKDVFLMYPPGQFILDLNKIFYFLSLYCIQNDVEPMEAQDLLYTMHQVNLFFEKATRHIE
jgi:thiamine pyrophosphokinase